MKRNQQTSLLGLFIFLVLSTVAFAPKGAWIDTKFHSQSLSISIAGTSTLHDWVMKSDKGRSDVVFTLAANDKITDLAALNFTMPAESLKSEHDMMDKNAYKALKTDKNKNITFSLSSADVAQLDANSYQIKAIGTLNIGGTAKQTDLVATAKYNAGDKSFTVTGSKKIKMTDWGVKPPTVMMGTIKTGNDLTINFNTKIVR